MIRLKFTLIFLSLILSTFAFAQSGKITGKVLDGKNAEPLIGVAVTIENTTRGGVTDLDGIFVIEGLTDGTYTIQASYVGYTSKKIGEIVVKGTESVVVDINLEEASLQIEAVVVTAKRKQEALSTVLTIQRNSITVSDVLSGETIRRSPDRNVGDAIKRVSGVTIQDNKFPVVRGLNDRYNVAFVNGLPLPSTEPDRKAFSFDIFPSNIIDNIVVNKAATPDMPAEFAGGLIQLNTKDIPDDNFMQAQVGIGLNTETMGEDFFKSSTSGGRDWIGVDDGTRALPALFPTTGNLRDSSRAFKAELGKSFLNDWELVNAGSAKPSYNVQLSGGFSKKVGEEGRFGGVFSLGYNRNDRVLQYNRDFFDESGSPNFRYRETRNYTSLLNGVLANLSYRINGANKISFKNNINVNTDISAILRNGPDVDNFVYESGTSISRFQANRFISNQLTGEHAFGTKGMKLNWNVGRNNIFRNSPNWSQVTVSAPADDPSAIPTSNYGVFFPTGSGSATSAGRQFFKLDETNWVGTFDFTVPLKVADLDQSVKVGGFYNARDRDYDVRILGLRSADVSFESPVTKENSLSSIFSPSQYGTGRNNLMLDEIGFPSDSYDAEANTTAAYLMLDNKFAAKFRLIWGLRYENYVVSLGSKNRGSAKPNVDNVAFGRLLPSFNFIYNLTEKSNIRLSGSKTVSRPELRELAPFFFFDVLEQRGKTGVPGLIQTDIWNGDIRYELFPEGGQLFSVSFFYKYFQNPVEERVDGQSVANIRTTFVNTDKAVNFGAELELRKNLSFISSQKFFEDFTVFGNLSLIKSSVTVDAVTRPLQGQSPYAINFGLQYNNIENGINSTLLFNQVGRRINLVNGPGFPSVWENPRALLDFQFGKRILKQKGEIKFSISDILNSYYRFYQDRNNNGSFDNDVQIDNPFVSYRPGTTFSLSFSYRL